ncbi:polyhydroxyalkanoic acid system family protein [Alteriqipengyuania sp. WL0013]|uniref:polyhydroxyalkanoic acid system family protein n=1 Tax=Alteriqipengyuania sp. WL0013 TaxID=3110773 RepID=UPI002C63FC46|nr:polyhydroxyalkanoic acid system family protein [Alteriqipengyuania sp. WL0013]MEB3415956.1 polyhydroxyalkanoic acid system family protein [Alteriqipengyuania sp. WL0013]
MRAAIPHQLPKEEVRRRLRENIGELKDFVPGGAKVGNHWKSEDVLAIEVGAMGQSITGDIIVEEHQVIFQIELPGMLSFVEPMIQSAIRSQAPKLLAPPET